MVFKMRRRLHLLFILVCCIVVMMLFLFSIMAEKKRGGFNRESSYDLWNYSKAFIKDFNVKPKNLTLDGGEVVSYYVFPNTEQFNDIQVITGECTGNSALEVNTNSSHSRKRITLVTDFTFLQHRKRETLFIGNRGNVSDEEVMARDMEIIGALVKNLHHPIIEEIHLLVEDGATAEYLRHLWIPHSAKVVIRILNDLVTMKRKFEYANNCLKDKLVAIAHQDNVFGKGWEKIRPDILKTKRLMYVITRHSTEHVICAGSKGAANCDPGSTYFGSHDVFLYHVKEQWTSELMKRFESITPNLNGMENVLIWFFKTKLRYKILNPCKTLFIHHHHCIPVREKGRRSVNTKNTTGYSGFTDKLE